MNPLDILSAENFQLTLGQTLSGKGRKSGIRKQAGTLLQSLKRRRNDSKTGALLPAGLTNTGMLNICIRYAVTNGVTALTFKQVIDLHSALFKSGKKRTLFSYDAERIKQRHKRLGGYFAVASYDENGKKIKIPGKVCKDFPGLLEIDCTKCTINVTPEGVNVFGSRSIYRTAEHPIKKAVAIATRPAKDKKPAAKKPAAKKPAAKKPAAKKTKTPAKQA